VECHGGWCGKHSSVAQSLSVLNGTSYASVILEEKYKGNLKTADPIWHKNCKVYGWKSFIVDIFLCENSMLYCYKHHGLVKVLYI
jgi:hypothetical protein